MTERGQLIRDDSFYPVGWKYAYASSTGATVVKSSAGFLHSITFNKPVATSVISLCDSSAGATGTFGIITVPSSPQPVTLRYDVTLTNGIVLNITTAASDITISYV